MAIVTQYSRASRTSLLLGPIFALAVLPYGALAAENDSNASDDQGTRAPIIVNGHAVLDANPNADPEARYKVEKSTNDKFTEPVRDTPRSVTIIPKEVLQDTGATSFRDVARITPGVTLGTGEGGNAFGDRIFIRGFEARNDVYIDGMRDPGVSSRETFAVEQIEIVKGASSAYGGSGTTGGLVSLESKKALDRNFEVVEGGLGTDAYTRVTVDANRKLTDNLALRVNGLFHDADTAGRRQVYQRRFGGAAALAWKPTSTVTVDADFYHYSFTGMSDYGIPFDPRSGRPFAVDPSNFYGAVGRDFIAGEANVGTLTLHWRPSEAVALRSMTRYGAVASSYVASVPGRVTITNANPALWTVNVSATTRDAVTRDFDTIEDATLRFDTAGIGHTVVTGFEYAHQTVTNYPLAIATLVEDASGNMVATPTTRTVNLFTPHAFLGVTVPVKRDPTRPPSVNVVDTASAYLLDTIKLSRHFELTGGLRYDNYRIHAYGGTGAAAYDRRQTVSFVNWQASMTYKPVEAATFYASVSTSSNPSGEQLDSTADVYGGLGVGTINLAPERNHAYEVGAKYETFGGHALLTAAAFRIDKDNAREQIAANVYQLVGTLRSQGFELGVSGNITPKLAVFGGYTYLDAKVVSSPPGVTSIPMGARLANIPKHNGSILVTYAVSKALTLGGQATHRSAILGGTLAPTVPTTLLPGFWRYDAVMRVRLSDDLELRANVLNIGNKRYFDAIYRSAAPFSYVAPGRSATFSLTAKFK